MRILSTLLLALLVAACSRHPARVTPGPVPAAPAPPAEAPPAPARLPFVPHPYPATYCVIRGGRMAEVEIDPRDSTYQGQPIARAFPTDSSYALNAAWYRDNEPITVAGRRYVKYGLPRILGITDVVPVAAYHTVAVFAEPGTDPLRPEVVYLPVRPGCEFQPYTGGGIK